MTLEFNVLEKGSGKKSVALSEIQEIIKNSPGVSPAIEDVMRIRDLIKDSQLNTKDLYDSEILKYGRYAITTCFMNNQRELAKEINDLFDLNDEVFDQE